MQIRPSTLIISGCNVYFKTCLQHCAKGFMHIVCRHIPDRPGKKQVASPGYHKKNEVSVFSVNFGMEADVVHH